MPVARSDVGPAASGPPAAAAAAAAAAASAARVPAGPGLPAAQLPHVLLAAVPPVGRVLLPGAASHRPHQVRAQHGIPGQQLRPHHAHLQPGEGAPGE